MKNNFKYLALVFLSLCLIRCSYEETEFGFNGTIKGQITDPTDNPLYGDMTSNTLVVKLLGKGDKQAIEIRVNGEGKYQNLKMYPKMHKAWLEGPIVKTDTLMIDFASNANQTGNFKVTPLISPKVQSGTATGTTINVAYAITPASGITAKKMEIYCSTVKFPTASTGSLANVYFTKITPITALTGSVAITGLTAATKYYIRIGAQASTSSLFNFSNQIEVTTP
jgi:hypothetical protein